MNNFILVQTSVTRIEIPTPELQRYSLEEAAERVSIHPQLLRHYCHAGLLGEARADLETEPTFDDDALYAIRRIEEFRHRHGVNLKALPLVLGLSNEVEKLRNELRHLRF